MMPQTHSSPDRPKLLFVGHEFHRKTRSSQFMIDILHDHFDVAVMYVDPAKPFTKTVEASESEYVYVWQMDYLAPLFLAQGKRVIISPMYDASYPLNDMHWKACRQARFVNFSLFMHGRAIACQADSMLVKYFPDPSCYQMVGEFSQPRAFFWQRLPESILNYELVDRLLGDNVDHLHLHMASDTGLPFSPPSKTPKNRRETFSNWFPEKEDLERVMSQSNLFIAPRPDEGIGMAFLEAMARGMVVIAMDRPTHSEYIDNWVNGILINRDSHDLALRAPETLHKIGANARRTVEKGYAKWKKSIPDIIEYILETPPAQVPEHNWLLRDCYKIAASRVSGIEAYHKALELFPLTVQILASWQNYNEQENDPVTIQSEQKDISPSLVNQTSVLFGIGNGLNYLGDGWWKSGEPEKESSHTWAVSAEATIHLPFEFEIKLLELYFEARAIQRNRLEVVINDEAVGEVGLNGKFTPHRLDLTKTSSSAITGKIFDVTFRALEREDPPATDPRPVVFAMAALRITWKEKTG